MAEKYTTAAINSLSDVEKLRFVLAYLHHREPKNVDWAAAAAHSGSKTKQSFKVLFNNTLKKLQTLSEGAANAPLSTPTPKTLKRKKTAISVGDDGVSPSPKARGHKKAAKVDEPIREEGVEEEGSIGQAVSCGNKSFFDTAEET